MYCSIAGTVPTEPVVSRLNGALYERSIIEKYIDENARDPHTREPMSKDDLIPVRSGAASGPRAAAASSIPGLLAQLHSEWDAVMLEQFSLRQQLTAAQQELSHALYKHDAACRVIARLIAERDDARRQAGLSIEGDRLAGQESAAANRDKADGGVSSGLPPAVVAEIDTHTERLRAERKRREIPREVPTPAAFGDYVETADMVPTHMTSTGTATGISAIAVAESNGMQAVFSGGSDGKIICYDVTRQSALGTLLGHQGPVRDIECALDFVVSCSDDSTTRVWRSEVGNYTCRTTLKGHRGGVSGLTILPSRHQVLTGGMDGLLQFQDLEAGVVVATGRSHDVALGISTVALHPDGFIAATGSGAVVHLWDVRGMDIDVAINLPNNAGVVNSIAFSENGYMMAGAGSNGVVQLFDLRKGTETPFDTLVFDDHGSARPCAVSEIAFDPSGQYLAVATNAVKVFHVNDISSNQIAAFSAHVMPVTSIAWGKNATWLASGSMDRRVKVWSQATKRK